MTWRELIEDNKTKRLSSARFVAVTAGLTLAVSTLVMTAIVYWRVEVIPALTVGLGALAGLAGANYVAQKVTDGKDRTET